MRSHHGVCAGYDSAFCARAAQLLASCIVVVVAVVIVVVVVVIVGVLTFISFEKSSVCGHAKVLEEP